MATGTKRWRDEVEVPADMVIGHNATNVAMLLNNHTGNVDSAERYEPRLTKRGKAVTAAHVQAARAALDEIEAELPERIRRLAAKSERELAKARVVLDSIEATLKRRNIL